MKSKKGTEGQSALAQLPPCESVIERFKGWQLIVSSLGDDRLNGVVFQWTLARVDGHHRMTGRHSSVEQQRITMLAADRDCQLQTSIGTTTRRAAGATW